EITGDGRNTCKQTTKRTTRPPVHFMVRHGARDHARVPQATQYVAFRVRSSLPQHEQGGPYADNTWW
ncbi:hypothetical protein, partial [Novipirellula herctigrandis]|uniref:hypothetical protein n=1 Tax=Novipirellula herctigrandis TaxID=2527986 RepID=UPI003AF3ECB9